MVIQESLAKFMNCIYKESGSFNNCWGFTDGTVGECCRPGESQCALYNGHHRTHG